MYRQSSTTLQNSTPKWVGENLEAYCRKRSIMEHSPGLPQDTKSLRSSSLNWVKVFLEWNVTLNTTRSSDSFSTVPPIVNGEDWGCIAHDLETIIVLVLLTFNFIPQKSHHLLTLTRSQIKESATVTLMPGYGTTAIQVESPTHNQLIFQNGKKIQSIQEEQ